MGQSQKFNMNRSMTLPKKKDCTSSGNAFALAAELWLSGRQLYLDQSLISGRQVNSSNSEMGRRPMLEVYEVHHLS